MLSGGATNELTALPPSSSEFCVENHVQENIIGENLVIGLEKVLLILLVFECDFTLGNLILLMRVLTSRHTMNVLSLYVSSLSCPSWIHLCVQGKLNARSLLDTLFPLQREVHFVCCQM